MNAKVLVLLLAAMVGGSIWLALARTTAPVPVGGPVEPGANTATTPTSTPAPLVTSQGAVVDPAAALVVGDDGKRTEAAPSPAASVATVMVRGRVIDPAGNPRAGVDLTLPSWRTNDFDPDFVFDLPASELGAASSAPRARTGDDGRFALALAADRSGALELVGDGLVFVGAAPRARGGKGDQDLGDVSVVRAAVVRGRVQDEAGKPVAGARVVAERGLFGRADQNRVVTAVDGAFAVGKLRPGAFTLRIAVAGYLPHAVELELQAEEQRDGVVVTLRTGKAIAGRVVDDRGVGVAGAKVGAKRKEVRTGMDVERFASDEAAQTDANGWFTLAGLGDDVVTVSAFGKEHTTATAADVALGTLDLLLRVERLGAIEGTLVGADGAPIAGSEVRLGAPNGDGAFEFVGEEIDVGMAPMRRNRPARSGADGSFRLEGVKPGTVTVSASGKGHRPARADGVKVVAAQTTAEVRLVADRGAVARVRVVDPAGAPVAGAKVRAARPPARPGFVAAGGENVEVSMRATSVAVGGEIGDLEILGGGPLASGVTDADGRCELTGLPAGDTQFTAKHKDHADAAPTTVVLPDSGGVDLALALRVPGFVAVTVLGVDGKPVAEAEVMIEPAGGGGGGRRKLATDAEGKATSAALAPGDYSAVLARAAKSRSVGAGSNHIMMVGGESDVLDETRAAIVVVAGKTAEVTLRQPVLARVHGVVTGADGPVAGCVVELERGSAMQMSIPGFGGGGLSTTTGADGTFAFEGVASGDYTASYGREQAIVKAEAECAVPPGVADVRLDLALRTGVVRVRALDEATGKPVVGAEVEIRRSQNGARGGTTRSAMVVTLSMTADDEGGEGMTTMTLGAQKARTDEQGVAVFDDVPEGEWSLSVTHKSHAPADARPVVVAERQTADAGDVAMAAAGEVRGAVVGADGRPERMAMVQRRAVGETDWTAPEMAMGGKYRMRGLAPGRYELRARALGPDEKPDGDPVVVEVKAGETAQVELQTK